MKPIVTSPLLFALLVFVSFGNGSLLAQKKESGSVANPPETFAVDALSLYDASNAKALGDNERQPLERDPNPGTGILRILSVDGCVLHELPYSGGTQSIPVHRRADGTYPLKEIANGRTELFIKQ